MLAHPAPLVSPHARSSVSGKLPRAASAIVRYSTRYQRCGANRCTLPGTMQSIYEHW